MTTHQVNLEYLAEAANLLMGPQGALRLSAVYTTIENVAKRAQERKDERAYQEGYEEGYIDGARSAIREQEQDEMEPTDELLTLNEAAHGDDDVAYKTHYDTWSGRFHRPGAAE